MTFLDALERELSVVGIPARRRIRILTEFSDHLHEDPQANLGTPEELARVFADELGTRLARGTAYRAFGLLTVAAVVLSYMFFNGGRTWGGWVGYGSYPVSDYLPGWWVPMMVVWVVAAQVALASGVLAALRAWRLRHVHVITTADAAILNRRAAVGLVCGAITMTVLPVTRLVVGEDFGPSSNLVAGPSSKLVTFAIGPVLIILLLAMLPDVLRATRLRPQREGQAGDLTADIGTEDPRITPSRIALALCIVIVAVMVLIGVHSNNISAGVFRGLFDSATCLIGFAVLGRYLGLRRASRSVPDGPSGTRTRAVLGLGILAALLLTTGLALRLNSDTQQPNASRLAPGVALGRSTHVARRQPTPTVIPPPRSVTGWSCPVTETSPCGATNRVIGIHEPRGARSGKPRLAPHGSAPASIDGRIDPDPGAVTSVSGVQVVMDPQTGEILAVTPHA